MPTEERAAAAAELNEYLAARVPEALAQRVHPLPALFHVWACFWELQGLRPVLQIPVGMGASVPLRGELPWDKVGDWLTEREILDRYEREQIRGLLRSMDRVYLERQQEGLSQETGEEESDG